MRVLVTGGAGFIGSHYVRSLLDGTHDETGATAPQRVIVLDKLTYAGNLANLDPVRDDGRLEFVEGDIADPGLVARVVADVDTVVHLAAETHVDRSLMRPADFVMTNVVGTQTLLDTARRHRVDRFVHVSTDEVYGSRESGASTESDPLRPSSPYAATKAGSDLLALAYANTYGLPVSVTRSANTYGPYQYPDKIIPLFVTNLLRGERVPLYGDGQHVRDWLHVDDHARALHRVVELGRPGAIYHVGGGTELTNEALTARLLEACGAEPDAVERVADRPGHDRRYLLDTTRTQAELGWAPRVPFDTGLVETVAWFATHREWWEPLRERATPVR